VDIVLVIGLVITVITAIPVLLQLRDHPKGLYILFFAEMWERFSYYGMRALFIYYLTQHFLFDDRTAASRYGAYATLIYLLPLVGGVLADRYLGTRKAITFGAILLTVGQLGLAIQGPPAQQVLTYGGQTYTFEAHGRGDARQVRLEVAGHPYAFSPTTDGGLLINDLPASAPLPRTLPKGSYTLGVQHRSELFANILYLALALIVMGVGYLKANIASIVGQLYPEHDPRRDAGFTLYYYGINLGAFWSAAICGAVGQSVGWWAGFGLAGVGMAAGLLVFVLGKPLLQGKGEPPDVAALKRQVIGPVSLEHALYLAGFVGVALAFVLLQHNGVVGALLGVGSVAVLGYIGWWMVRRCDRIERDRLALALALVAGSVVFWTLFEQAGSSLSLFAARNTQLPSHGFVSVNAAQTQSFNPGFILLFAPVFAALWPRLAKLGRDPNPAIKFGLGLVQVGAGFLVLVAGAGFADAQFRLPLVFLGLAYLLHTTGEMCLSPVGLSQVTKLAPALLISTLMAVWYLSISWAEWIGGFIAQFAGSETVGGQVLDPRAALANSLHVFGVIGWAAVGAGVLFFALSPLLKRWAHGASDSHTDVAPEPFAPVVDGDRAGLAPATLRGET
jgi:proton-dependent oligopeptide transporter, POT family